MLRAAQSNSLEKQLIEYHQQHSIAASIASIYQDEMTKSNAHEIEWFYVLQRSLEMELDYAYEEGDQSIVHCCLQSNNCDRFLVQLTV